MLIRSLALLVALVAICSTAHADTFSTVGSDEALTSCGLLVAAFQIAPVGTGPYFEHDGQRLSSEKRHLIAYAMGFATGYNLKSKRAGQAQIQLDGASLELWLTNYCTAHAESDFIEALVSLANETATVKKPAK